ncbi:MAG: SsrA-binding protein [Flavobacteriales bacterium]
MRRSFFRLIARINKALLPTLWHRDLRRLSKLQMAIAAWRYFVTKNAL